MKSVRGFNPKDFAVWIFVSCVGLLEWPSERVGKSGHVKRTETLGLLTFNISLGEATVD